MKKHQSRQYTTKEMADIQQPLDYKTGYSNPHFDKLYGDKSPNPFHNTERDIKNKKNYHFDYSIKCDLCDNKAEFSSIKNGEIEYKLCRDCYKKRL